MHRADGWARWVALLATTFVAGVMALLLFLVVGSPFFGGASNVALERHDLTAKPPALAITRSTADLATQLAVRSDAGDYACDRPPVVGGSVANAPPTSASAESDRFSLTSRSARIAGGEAYGQAGNPAERAGVLAVLAGDALATRAAPEAGGGGGRTFTHFTDEAGAKGITGKGPLSVGENSEVGRLNFGKGQNSYLANAEGDNFVTDLGPGASPRQLSSIGVYGEQQQYTISFFEEDAFTSGARVRGSRPEQGIYTIPGPCEIIGICTVTRVR